MTDKTVGMYFLLLGLFILAGNYFGIIGVAILLILLGILTLILGE